MTITTPLMSHRRSRWVAALCATIAAITLVSGMMQPSAASAAGHKPVIKITKPVPGTHADALGGRKAPASSSSAKAPARETPVHADATVVLPTAKAKKAVALKGVDSRPGTHITGAWAGAAGTDLQLAAAETVPTNAKSHSTPTKVRIVRATTLDAKAVTKAGLTGLVLQLRRADGGADAAPVAVRIPKRTLAGVYGADYSSRVRWMQVSGTTLTTATEADAVPVLASIDPTDGSSVVTPMLAKSAITMFAAAAPVSAAGTGDFTATSLKPSQAWDVSAATGTFSWSYPFTLPPAPAGKTPALSLSYDSQSVDGLTGSTNNQPSAIGEGWSLGGAGFIERSYVGCATDDGPSGPVKTSGDLCWKTDNATVSFAGHSGQLIKDTSSGQWHLQGDDGTRFEQLKGAPCPSNTTYDSSCWRMTTTDGTQYFFGMYQLPGRVSGQPTTGSVWTVPVFGNDPGEPCHAATFAASSCVQAWRWNLDYVVDVHGNAQAYYYNAQTNMYAKNGTTATSYVRGGELNHIDYGLTAATVYTANAASGKVVFTYDTRGRCSDSSGATCTTQAVSGAATIPATPTAYPDIPFDQLCTTGACAGLLSPTFWTTSALTKVTTQALVAGAYANVDTYALGHSYPNPGDGTTAALWLTGVTHTGYAGSTTLAEPSVTFTGATRQNRVWAVDGLAPLDKYRITSIQNELGAVTSIVYSAQECTPGEAAAIMAAPETNTKRCFPQWWSPRVTPPQEPQEDLFHKYVVTAVTQNPMTGGAGAATSTTSYVYGTPAWRYNPSPLIPAGKRTWSIFAGFNTTEVRTGNSSDPSKQSVTRYTFYQGLDGDRANAAGGTKQMSVAGSPDSLWFAGRTRQTVTTAGVGGTTLSTTVDTPWASSVTADDGTYTARHTGTGTSVLTQPISGGGNRTTTTTTAFDDATGLPLTQTVAPSDASSKCTVTAYADQNPTAWIIGAVKQVTSAATDCGHVGTATADQFISGTRTSYDNQAVGAAPTFGDPTKMETITGITGTTPAWTTSTSTAYDIRGRSVSVNDILGHTTTTAYAPAAGTIGPLTSTTVTNTAPFGWTTTTTFDPARGSALTVKDPNANVSSAKYDALGRLVSMWKPDRPQATNASTPSARYSYSMSKTAPSWRKTEIAGPGTGSYIASYDLYDGLGRVVQTQAPAAGANGGSVMVDTTYDDHGRTTVTNNKYWATPAVSGTLFVPASQQQVPSKTLTDYDTADRPIKTTLVSFGNEIQSTNTSYLGADRVDTTPPAGGTPSTTITNSVGQKTSLTQYSADTISGTGLKTSYVYNAQGSLSQMTDPAGNNWSWAYDVQGHQTTANDPDAGTTTSTYDLAGNVLTTTDARGSTVAHTYDALSRKTGTYAGSTTGALLASWTFDTLAKGQLASSSSYTGSTPGHPGLAYTTETTGYDSLYEPSGTKYTIPTGAPAFAGTTYTVSNSYTNGYLGLQLFPAVGGIGTERVSYLYDALGNTVALQGLSYYAYNDYDPLSRIGLITRGTSNSLFSSYGYDNGTGAISNIVDTTQIGTTFVDQANRLYTRNLAGDVTNIKTVNPSSTDNQCFAYDHLQNLTAAWTTTGSSCPTTPTSTTIGGPAPYWSSYTIDPATGNRTSSTANPITATGTASTRTYAYPAPGDPRPHAVSQIADSAGTSSFGYDADGNTTTRPGQTLAYNEQGKPTSITTGTATQNNVYDADGNLMLEVDSKTGNTAHFGQTELHTPVGSSTITATRTYSVGDIPVAERISAVTYFIGGDANHTQDIQMVESTGALSRRYTDPYGNARGAAVAWAAPHGYLNQPTNSTTALAHLGARDYDSALGRFLSVDSVLAPMSPAQNNGYSYSVNNPVTLSDPSGNEPTDPSCKTVQCRNAYYGGPPGNANSAPPAAGNTPESSSGTRPSSQSGCGSYCSAWAPRQESTVEPVNPEPVLDAISLLPIAGVLGKLLRGGLAVRKLVESAPDRPAGVPEGYVSSPSRNGGTVWRPRGSVTDHNSVRFSPPSERYPYGNVRFYNDHAQPIDINGKPTGPDKTHFPIDHNGKYQMPSTWPGSPPPPQVGPYPLL